MSKRTLKPVELDLDAPGKDLSHLFAASLSSGAPELKQAELLSPDLLEDNPYQPRLQMREDTLEELAGVIAGQGFQGALAARPHPELKGHYQLAMGHRRREAAKRAGLRSVPVVVRDLTDEEMVTIAITENIQRDDLTPLEEGRIYTLMQTEMSYTLEQIAREIGKKLGYVYNRVRVAKAPPDVQALVQQKPDSLRAVANLIKVEDEGKRAELIDGLLAGTLTTDDLPIYIARMGVEAEGPTDDGRRTMDDGQLDLYPLTPNSQPPQTVLVNGAEMMEVERNADVLSPTPYSLLPTPRSPELARLRARRAKLSRAHSALRAFSAMLGEATEISSEERIELATISILAARLYERFDVKKGE